MSSFTKFLVLSKVYLNTRFLWQPKNDKSWLPNGHSCRHLVATFWHDNKGVTLFGNYVNYIIL
jgi:hypothetical protein